MVHNRAPSRGGNRRPQLIAEDALLHIAELALAEDREAALAATTHLERAIHETRDLLAMLAVLRDEWSYARLGRALGMTRQAARNKYKPLVLHIRHTRLPLNPSGGDPS